MLSWDRETDVVVLGSGAAGLTAALTASVNGASVEIYEKAPTVGGTSAVSGGIVRIKLASRAGEHLTAAPEFDDCVRVAAATGRPVKAVQAEALQAWKASEDAG